MLIQIEVHLKPGESPAVNERERRKITELLSTATDQALYVIGWPKSFVDITIKAHA